MGYPSLDSSSACMQRGMIAWSRSRSLFSIATSWTSFEGEVKLLLRHSLRRLSIFITMMIYSQLGKCLGMMNVRYVSGDSVGLNAEIRYAKVELAILFLKYIRSL